MRRLVYYIAVSLDGFVARHDSSVGDFTFEGDHAQDLLKEFPETFPTHLRDHFSIDDPNRHFDTVVMGRATYQLGLDLGITSPYQHLNQYVFSRSIGVATAPDVTFIPDDPVAFVRDLKSQDGLDIWLCGGPILATCLIDELDDLVLKVNPFLMGNGKSLFAESFAKRDLRIRSQRAYPSGFSLLHYELQREPNRQMRSTEET